MSPVKLLGKILLEGVVYCETGLRIGGVRENLEIGGIENIIIRDLKSEEPCVLNSSLKGKTDEIHENQFYGRELDVFINFYPSYAQIYQAMKNPNYLSEDLEWLKKNYDRLKSTYKGKFFYL